MRQGQQVHRHKEKFPKKRKVEKLLSGGVSSKLHTFNVRSINKKLVPLMGEHVMREHNDASISLMMYQLTKTKIKDYW